VIDAVVKVGGSLSRGTCLPAVGARLVECGRRRGVLVVPGGGAFADVVREHDARFGLRPGTAHRMAVLSMDQYGHLLGDFAPGSVLVRTLDEAHAHLEGGGVAILLPAELLRRADPLPHTWEVTSDSIAAWLAGRVGAALLVLLKDRRGMAGLASAVVSTGRVSVSELAAAGVVDEHFAGLLDTSGFGLWIVDGERPERLCELLETGSTEGVRLARRAP